jgi:hypothetical protein
MAANTPTVLLAGKKNGRRIADSPVRLVEALLGVRALPLIALENVDHTAAAALLPARMNHNDHG